MAKTLKKITFLDPMSDAFSDAVTGAFRAGVDEVVRSDITVGQLRGARGVRHARSDSTVGQLRASHGVRHAKKKKQKKARR